MTDCLRPNRSDTQPETNAPNQEPPGMAATMPPWVVEVGPRHSPFSSRPRWLNLHRYGCVEMMADMDVMSKPNSAPPN